MNLSYKNIHLVFFLSRATPLSRWHKMGILERETAIYKRLASHLGKVSIVTSGGEEELAYQEQLGQIEILYNRWGLSPNLYGLLAPFLHWSALRQASVYKTNQLDGSWTAIIAGMLHRRPVIVRAGYLWAELHRQNGGQGIKAAIIDRLQAFSFRRADRIMLTTEAMKRKVSETYKISLENSAVIPNYVDTDRLSPMPTLDRIKGRICFVGRLHPVKNLDLLIEALGQLPQASLVLVGRGQQREELERLAQHHQANVQFLGVLPHAQIPLELNRSEVFILPSRSEGHPKALIEAMSCGLPVIGTDVSGIRELIQHGKTGWLCQPNLESIRAALQELLAQPQLRAQLADNARQYALEHFALDKIVELELKVLTEVAAS